MSKLIIGFRGLVSNLSFAFEGRLGHDNKHVSKMRDEVLFDEIPSFSQDRQNLKSDGKTVVKNFNNAFKEYKSESKAIAQ